MHVIEAEMIMKNDPPVGRGDSSRCLPDWIQTLCKKVAAGNGYTISHKAATALCHTLVAARVRTERLVEERDRLSRELASAHRKASHGCYDFNCPECDQ